MNTQHDNYLKSRIMNVHTYMLIHTIIFNKYNNVP